MKMTSSELASIVSNLSGRSFESCLHDVNEANAIDAFGSVRTDSLDSLAGRLMIPGSALASALSRATGRAFEDVTRDVNRGADPMRPTYRSGWFSDSK